MNSYLCFMCSLALIAFTSAAVPPITKCKSDDAKCAKESAKKLLPTFAEGIPELGVETLDPLNFKKIDASKENLKFLLTDVSIVGLKNCQPKKIQRDVAHSKMFLKFQCDCILDAQYELEGQILLLTFKGKGKMHVGLKKAVISVDVDMAEKNGADSKVYWHLKSWSHSYELKDKADLQFGGLFDGNEVLAKATQELIANSGNEIIYEIGGPVFKAVVNTVMKNTKNFFHHVLPEDLALD